MKKWQYESAADLDQTLIERLRQFPREPDMLVYGVRSLVALIIRALLRIYHRFEIIGEEHLRTQPIVRARRQSFQSSRYGLPSRRAAVAQIASRFSGGGGGLFFPKRAAHLDRHRGVQCLAVRAAEFMSARVSRFVGSFSAIPAMF